MLFDVSFVPIIYILENLTELDLLRPYCTAYPCVGWGNPMEDIYSIQVRLRCGIATKTLGSLLNLMIIQQAFCLLL